VANQAAGGSGKGGGIWAEDASTIQTSSTTLFGANSAINGGGLYLENGSSLNATDTFIGFPLLFLWPNLADYGAGIYANSSTVNFNGTIDLNIAEYAGAGIYATDSTVNLADATIGGNTESWQGNQLGPSGHEGVGIYLTNATQAILDNTAVVSNTFQTAGSTFGGGIYVTNGSDLTLRNNSSIEDHTAPSLTLGRGGGIYMYASTVTLDNSQVISNTAGTNGGGIRMWGASTLNVNNGAEISYNRTINAEGGGIAASATEGAPDINITGGTLQHNHARTNGGAIYLNVGTLDLEGWWDLRWNRADGNGGAVAVLGTGDADFNATTGISHLGVNNAVGNGGALYVGNTDYVAFYATSGYQLRMNTNNAGGDGGAAYSDSGAFFDVFGDVQATSNIANGNGGAFYLSGGSGVWLDDYNDTVPKIWVNSALYGGAIYAKDSPRVECDGAEIGGSRNGNEATAGDGGAFYLIASTLTTDNCLYQNNDATRHGGAIAAVKGSNLTIGADYLAPLAGVSSDGWRDLLSPEAPTATGCNPSTKECSSFRYNRADSDSSNGGNGGAIYSEESSLDLSYTYLHHNSAELGGAVYQTGSNSTGTTTNSLYYSNANSGKSGAAIRSDEGSFTLNQVTLADNVGGPGFYGNAAASNGIYSSIAWGNSVGGFIGTFSGSNCNIDQSGNVGTNTDPYFVNPAAVDYHLSTGSPAVDACSRGVTPDLDNRVRPFGSDYDMGAYEYYQYWIYLPLIIR
jgi:hypothetical protein